ncbi:aromatic cluster surface protein [Mycoplasmoides fastidiosum]|uniref:Aromatic cluster surface protein n=1 Tax=Mycoplasmoides fastidiosum TaxID=92758 RepID=A0ABU0LZ26_9BACT|nr:aromatic motif membrane protein [Mycoplasmoides fastidiosum]MDQ0513940.1 aromatic cluster surface protein [Mycoplasmoides fastidiosum]UUD37646.1 hypothetical protein NPA10_03705 [Mycoplasmoides fastidiosum]
MKIKQLFTAAFLSLIPVLSACAAPSNTYQKIIDQIETAKSAVTETNDWQNFLNTRGITELLNLIFPDPQARAAYIEKQSAIDSPSYLKEIKDWLQYFNYVQSNISANIFRGKPYIIEQSSTFLREMLNDNWLWFLYNTKNFYWLFFPELDLFSQNKNEYFDDLRTKNLDNGGFYVPEKFEVIDYSYMLTESNLDEEIDDAEDGDYYQEFIFFMLNQDGFIMKTNISFYYNVDKTTIQSQRVRLTPYLFSFPKILKNEHLKEIFSLSKYIQTYENFEGVRFSQNNKILFTDKYGKAELRYIFVDVKDDI